MSVELRSSEDYEFYIYSLPDRFLTIERSTLVFVRKGASLAKVDGELFFRNGMRLAVRERLLFDRSPGVIDWYGYELWQGEEKLFWYDSQPHPADPTLQQNHPHHKHVPPNIKHHRIPAPQMSFNRPNLSQLLDEIQQLIAGSV